MLYSITTNNSITFESHCPLTQDYTADRGIFVPLEFPHFSHKDILALQENSFGQNIANIMNLFFSTELNGWDVDFCIGRSTMRMTQVNGKLLAIELWHTPTDNFSYFASRLYATITKTPTNDTPTEWFHICVKIALLFATFGELARCSILESVATLDFSLSGNDLSMPLAAFYAKKMGLPIGSLIVSSDRNKSLWNLIHRGDIYLSDRSEALSVSIERLIHGTLGSVAACEFRQAYNQGQVYHIDEELLPTLNDGIFCVITGAERSKQTIYSVYRTNQYILDPETAMCVGGLQDYRSKSGEHNLTAVFSEQSPRLHLDYIESATGLTRRRLSELFSIL